MNTKIKLLTIGLILTLISCNQSEDKVGDKDLADKTNKHVDSLTAKSDLHDTSNQYIYNFMKFVIADQKLDLSYGLSIEPKQECYINQEDSIFLKTLLIEKSKKDTSDWMNRITTFNDISKCLIKADIEEMLTQKKRLSDFIWDISQLGFNKTNDNNWYSFSLPLFSKDKKKVVIMIKSLCSGFLCGNGRTVVFINQNNIWSSNTVGYWNH